MNKFSHLHIIGLYSLCNAHQKMCILAAYTPPELRGCPTMCHKRYPTLYQYRSLLFPLSESILHSDGSGLQSSLLELEPIKTQTHCNYSFVVTKVNRSQAHQKLPGHLTPTSSLCWQLWIPIPRFEQLRSEDSVPLHPT